EFTIFLTRSTYPLNWNNPSTLYKTIKKSFFRTTFHKKGKRFMGHASFNLKSSIINNDTLWMGIAPNVLKDISKILFKEKIGLGIIGIPFQSKIENREDIVNSLTFNDRHTETSFIKFLISKESAVQIVEFINCFKENFKEIYPSPSSFYGGAFWPLYKGEGAGCTALCLASLESGGIIPEDSIKNEWQIKVKLPMDLIGGRFNNSIKVPFKKIKKTKQWYNDNGQKNIDYIDFEIYDPNYMMNWVNKQMGSSTVHTYKLSDKVTIKGLTFDYRNSKPKASLEEIMIDRPEPCPFVKQYMEDLEILKQK
ncbi:MAG: hypothetical protein M9916_12960, partial [Crocinitomicaceae bacterium]|nr:hypothetical protein [Crocinitomicaceae bacterium]